LISVFQCRAPPFLKSFWQSHPNSDNMP
jgi:hypothetical protein